MSPKFAVIDNHKFFDPEAIEAAAFGGGRHSSRQTKTAMRKAKRALKVTKQQPSVVSYPPLVPKTEAQREYLDAIKENDVLFSCGAAGTGKTYVAARYALELLLAKTIKKIIITRPMVAVSNENLGFLPGGVDAKVEPWTIPLIEAFRDGAPRETITAMQKDGRIEFAPFAYIRGRTLKDAFILSDESQNLTIEQFRVLISRVGENSKIVINGDLAQSDLGKRVDNGLAYAIRLADQYDLDCEIFEFDDSDSVRSKITRQWVQAFTADDEKNEVK